MKKKLSMLMVFIFGVAMLATSVLASTINKTGYELLRDSAKTSILAYSDMANYTAYTSTTVIYDGKEIINQTSLNKKDGNITEASNYNKNLNNNNQRYQYYTYQDESKTINTSDFITYNWNDTSSPSNVQYNVTTDKLFSQQFNLYSKIADAAVATFNMQNVITAVKEQDGSYLLNGSISEGQIPVLINAVFSALFKTTFINSSVQYDLKSSIQNDARTEIGNANNPVTIVLSEDVYIKTSTGDAHINKDGIIDSGDVKATISGKDKKGVAHILQLEYKAEAKDIGTTTITEPDLTNKTVIKNTNGKPGTPSISKEKITAMLGKYKKDNAELKDGKLVKVGETIFDIKSISEDNKIDVDILTNDKDGLNIKKESTQFSVEYSDGNTIQMRQLIGKGNYSIVSFDFNSGSLTMYGQRNEVFARIFE